MSRNEITGIPQRAIKQWAEGMAEAPAEVKNSSRVMQMVEGIEFVAEGATIGTTLAEIATNADGKVKRDTQLKALGLIQKIFTAADVKEEQQNLENMNEEDLKAQLLRAAKSRCLTDEGLFLTLFYEVVQEKPHLWKQIQDSPPVTVIEVKVTKPDEPQS